MAHRIPGSANRYVKLSHAQLKPVTDIVREQLWPDLITKEREAAEQQRLDAESTKKVKLNQNLRLVS
jgi:hypothetical protein